MAGNGNAAPMSSTDVFLHTISYVPFAETIILPGRHLLDGEVAFEAAFMAKTLFREGLIVPERRHGATSFLQVAKDRHLGLREQARAEYLDHSVNEVRVFQWSDLSNTYRAILLDDLGPNGAFRRVVPGGLQGANKDGLDRARGAYEETGGTTPEDFVTSVAACCPAAAKLARKWAMARYYLTPASFDDIHVRQIPDEAADLLIRGRAIDHSLRPTGDLPPADRLSQSIKLGLQVNEVQEAAEAYCQAALRVRDDVPEARALFAKILNKTEAREIGEEVTGTMAKELQKQFRSKLIDRKLYSIAIDAIGGTIGGLIALPAGLSAAAGMGVGSALGMEALKHLVKQRYDRKKRPWKLAIDRLGAAIQRMRT